MPSPRQTRLPCGCNMTWNDDDAVMALCIKHSVEYDMSEGQDPDEFFKQVTMNQPEIKAIAEELAEQMR